MVVSARDLPGARLRRWGYHASLGIASSAAIWIAVTAFIEARRTAGEHEAALRSLAQHTEAADSVASDCGLDPFSHEASLSRFPIEIPPFPTPKERECIERVTNARADLIDDHLLIEQLEPDVEETAGSARTRVIVAIFLALVWAAGFLFDVVLPRRRAARASG